MTGTRTYTDQEIWYVLTSAFHGKSGKEVRDGFEAVFGRPLRDGALKYIKTKYGRDPRYNTPTVNGRLGDNRICERREHRLSPRSTKQAAADADAGSPSALDGLTRQDAASNALQLAGADGAPFVIGAESQAGTVPDWLTGYLPSPAVPDADDTASPNATSPNDRADSASPYASGIDWRLRIDPDAWVASAHSPPVLGGIATSQGARQSAASGESILSALDPSLGGFGGETDPSCICADQSLTDEEFDRLIMTLHHGDGGEEFGNIDSTTLGSLSLRGANEY